MFKDFYYQQLTQTPLYNTLYLNTVFTKKCNFNCSYCSQNNSKDLRNNLDLNIFKEVLNNLLKFNNIDKYIFSVMGGELSLLNIEYIENIFNIFNDAFNKKFDKIKLKKNNIKIVFVTNFSTDFSNIYNKYFQNEFLENNVLLDLAISHHHQNEDKLFNKTLSDFIDQKIILKRNILFTIKTFNENTYNKFIQLKNDFFINEYQKHKDSFLIEFGDKNWKIQKKIFSKIKKQVRPVICNAWNYNLDNSGNLNHLCTLEKIKIDEIKQEVKICSKRCSNYEIEQDTFKKIIHRHL